MGIVDRISYYFGSKEGFLELLIMLFCVFLSLTVHEFSHGFMAHLRGDDTAKSTGRLSFNPIHHIDPIGALCLFLFGFGWAKPVMVNPLNFRRKTMKRDMVLTSVAGPISNFIMAFLAIFTAVLVAIFSDGFIIEGSSIMYYEGMVNKYSLLAMDILQTLAMLNLGLGLFNLIPIPPLDGAKVLSAVLPTRIYFKLMEYERFGFIALIILINFPIFNRGLSYLVINIMNLFTSGSAAILGLFL